MKTTLNYWAICCLLVLPTQWLQAQTFFSIGSDANMYIQAGASVSFDSLVLSPSADVLMTPNDITKSAALVHTTTGTHINRVYQFTQPVPDFSGAITFLYQDAELNGLKETSLVLQSYDGSEWQVYRDNERNSSENYVTTPDLTGILLSEFTLSGQGDVLPLQWISLEATRNNALSLITWTTAQEVNCKYYQVQKSTDTRSWQNVGSPVAARNSAGGFNNYSLTDAAFLDGTAYYRIVLTDVNGRISYSTIVSVKDAVQNLVTVYPNPVTDVVNLRAGNGTMIKQVKVFDASGKLVMRKEGSNSNTYSFTVSALASGFYMMAIETSTGKVSKGFMKQ